MGKWRNEFNRDWDPYGGWEYGEGIEEELRRKAMERGESRARSEWDRFMENRCLCCKKKYASTHIDGLICSRCRVHAVCTRCHSPIWHTSRVASLFCQPCKDALKQLRSEIKELEDRERVRRIRQWVRDQVRRLAPKPPCPFHDDDWYSGFPAREPRGGRR
jgi:hypothetical protein